MSDFPAAHSMDTYWFAIDADENVAVFDTGEAGALPYSARKLFICDLILYLPNNDRRTFLLKTARTNTTLAAQLLGMFSYGHGDEWENWIAGPYTRNQQPEKLLKLEELPEDIQDLISWTWFEELCFQDTEIIQPIEYTKCRTWEGMGFCQGWVDTKGKIHEHLPNR